MNNRWCIISGPRTGSTWLEHLIWTYFKKENDKSVHLGEILFPPISKQWFYKLDENNYIIQKTGGYLGNNLYNDVVDLLKSSNVSQPIVLRVFTQAELYSKEQYIDFFHDLEKLGFKFISLNRNVFDRAVSLYFMEQSKIVHRWDDTNGYFYTNLDGQIVKNISEQSAHIIDENKFHDAYNRCNDFINLQQEIVNHINHIKVNYETMIEDCLIEQIPHIQPTIKKTYNESYSDKIEKNSWANIKTKYKKNNIKNTACQFAWDYSVLSLNRNELRNCCRAKARKIADYDFKKQTDLFTKSVTITKVKKELLLGVQSKDCESCWQIENNGGISQRSGYENFINFVKSNYYKTLSKEEVEQKLQDLSEDDINNICNIKNTRMIELSLGNTCDLKCVYCSHHYSSQWAAEKLRYKEIPIESIEQELPKVGNDSEYENLFWNWFEQESASKVKFINFIGGEPLIIDKFYTYTNRIINYYENNPNLQHPRIIGIVTNFNTPEKFYDKFIDFNLAILGSEKIHLDFNMSLEALGERTEFIRTNTDWNRLLNNFENYLQFLSTFVPENLENFPKVSISLQIALNTLSISNLPDFLKFVVNLQKKYNRRIGLRQNQVVYPDWCNPNILTQDYAKYIDEAIGVCESMNQFPLRDYPDSGKWDRYIKFLYNLKLLILNENNKVYERRRFVYNIDKLCERRNLNFHRTFPEMIDFYNLCKEL